MAHKVDEIAYKVSDDSKNKKNRSKNDWINAKFLREVPVRKLK